MTSPTPGRAPHPVLVEAPAVSAGVCPSMGSAMSLFDQLGGMESVRSLSGGGCKASLTGA